MNAPHDLPVTDDMATPAQAKLEIGREYHVSGYGVFTYEGNGLSHDNDPRYASFNGHKFQPVPGYTIKGTKNVQVGDPTRKGRLIEELPDAAGLNAALNQIRTGTKQYANDSLDSGRGQKNNIDREGLAGLVSAIQTTGSEQYAAAERAKTLLGCLIARHLEAKDSVNAERYVHFVCEQKRFWPPGLPILPLSEDNMAEVLDRRRKKQDFDPAFIARMNKKGPVYDDDAVDKILDLVSGQRPPASSTPPTTAEKPSLTKGWTPTIPDPQVVDTVTPERKRKPALGALLTADDRLLANSIAINPPEAKLVLRSGIGVITTGQLPFVNVLLNASPENAISSVQRQLQLSTRERWSHNETRGMCVEMFGGMTDNLVRQGHLEKCAGIMVGLYSKISSPVPEPLKPFLPAPKEESTARVINEASPAPIAPARAAPFAAPVPVSKGAKADDDTVAALETALKTAPPAQPQPAPMTAPPPAAPAAPPIEDLNKQLADVNVQIEEAQKTAQTGREKRSPTRQLSVNTTGHKPGTYIHADKGDRLESRHLNYDEPFDDGCQIMGAVITTFPKDPPSGLKVIQACKGKMIQGEFMLLSRAMLTPSVSLSNVAKAQEQKFGRPFDTNQVRDKYEDLIGRIADHPDYDDADRAYVEKMRQAVGLVKPGRAIQTKSKVKTSDTPDMERIALASSKVNETAQPKAVTSASAAPVSSPPAAPIATAATKGMITADDPFLKLTRDVFEDDVTATKMIDVCVGKMTRPEFKRLTLLMRGDSLDSKPASRQYSTEEQKHLTGLLDRVATHPEYNFNDRLYIGILYNSIGAQYPHQQQQQQEPEPDAPASSGLRMPPARRHPHGQHKTEIAVPELSSQPPTRVLITAHIPKSPDEPLTRAVQNELGNYDPNTAGAMIAEFAAANLKPFPFLLLSRAGLRLQQERLSFAQQAAETGFPVSSLREVFRGAAEVVQYRARKQGLHLLAANPVLNLFRDDDAAPSG